MNLIDIIHMKRGKDTIPVSFQRPGVAFDYRGREVPPHTPRFTHLIDGELVNGVLIEEAHTNLLPANISHTLTEPHTTGTLNGTYTFQCEGEGSYTLSGGATGEVSKDNPQTVTVSSATVTLTPTTTSTMNQILKLAYPLSWVLGGVTQPAETLTIPSDTLNLTGYTIELETYIHHNNRNDAHTIIQNGIGRGENSVTVDFLIDNLRLMIYDKNKGYKLKRYPTPPVGMCKIAVQYNPAQFNLFYNSEKATLQAGAGTGVQKEKGNIISIGWNIDGWAHMNTIIRDVTITGVDRTDDDIVARATRPSGKGFGVDRQVTIHAPLQHNLHAYKIRGGA